MSDICLTCKKRPADTNLMGRCSDCYLDNLGIDRNNFKKIEIKQKSRLRKILDWLFSEL